MRRKRRGAFIQCVCPLYYVAHTEFSKSRLRIFPSITQKQTLTTPGMNALQEFEIFIHIARIYLETRAKMKMKTT